MVYKEVAISAIYNLQNNVIINFTPHNDCLEYNSTHIINSYLHPFTKTGRFPQHNNE